MASTTFALVAAQYGNMIDAANYALRREVATRFTAREFLDMTGVQPRLVYAKSQAPMTSRTEGAEFAFASNTAITESLAGSAQPVIYADAHILTASRMAVEKADDLISDMLQHIIAGYNRAVDNALVASFNQFTAGTVGTGGGTITWANIAAAEAILKSAGAPGRLAAVLHPNQWYYLKTQTANVPVVFDQALRDQNTQYVGSFGDVDMYVSAGITAGSAAVAAMYANRFALGFDNRKGLTIAQEENPQVFDGLGGLRLRWEATFAGFAARRDAGVQLVGTTVI